MGTRFFKIVGVVSYGLAAVALVSAIILGLSAASGYFGEVDEDIDQPELSMEDYRQDVAPEPESDSGESAEQDTGLPEPDPLEAEADRLIKDLVKKIWEYTEATGQGDPKKDELENWLYDQTGDLRTREEQVAFLEGLNEAFQETLVEPAKDGDTAILTKNIPGLEDTETEHVYWAQFIGWYTISYMNHYREELARIQDERQQQLQDKQEAIITAGAAGTAFLLFMLATLVLILVRIEHNTRQTSA